MNCLFRRTPKNEEFVDARTEMRCKSLSFGDFGDDQKLLGESNADTLGFDSDGDETSDFASVDEGAIAILSMDEIRNMKRL